MVNEQRQLPDFQKYQYGALAGRLAQSEESSRYAPSALEMLAGPRGINLGLDAIEYHNSFGEQTQEQIAKSIRVYSGKFEEKRGEYKPVELANGWYGAVLNSLDKEDKDKILAVLGRHDETLGNITKKAQKAAYTVKAPKDSGLFTPEQKAEAEETLGKYQRVLRIIEALDRYTFEGLRPDAVKASEKQELKGLASQL